jgi:hypothetical protein
MRHQRLNFSTRQKPVVIAPSRDQDLTTPPIENPALLVTAGAAAEPLRKKGSTNG